MTGHRPTTISLSATIGLAARQYTFVLPSGAETRIPCVQVSAPDLTSVWRTIRGQDAILHGGRFATNAAELLNQRPGSAALISHLLPNGKPRYSLEAAFRNTSQREEAVAAALARLQSRNADLLRWREGVLLPTEIVPECVRDILTIVIGEARLAIDGPRRAQFERRVLHPVKFWTALVMLHLGIPTALVEMNCFEERHQTSPASLLKRYARLLRDSDSGVRHALEWIPAIGPTAFFCEMVDMLPRRLREIVNARDVDQAICLVESAHLLHRTRQAAKSAGTALADLPVAIGVEFLAATAPSRDLATKIAPAGDILSMIHAACRTARVRVAKETVRSPAFAFQNLGRANIRTAIMAFDRFQYRDTKVLLIRWDMGGTILMSVHQTDGEAHPPLVMPVRQARNAATVLDAETEGLDMVAEALNLERVEHVRQLMQPDTGYERVYLTTFTDRNGDAARCTVTFTHPEGSEGAKARFQGYDCVLVGRRGRDVNNTRLIDRRTYAEALSLFRFELGSTSPPFSLRRPDRLVAVRLSDMGGTVRIVPVDYPFSVLQFPALKREMLATGVVETVMKPLAAAGYVGTTRELPIGSQLAVTLPLEMDGALTIAPFLRVMRAYLGTATRISAVLNPRGVRRGYLTYIPPRLAKLLLDPAYAAQPTDPAQILAVIADCLLELRLVECYEVNAREYLLAIAKRACDEVLAKESKVYVVLFARGWHGRTHQFVIQKGEPNGIFLKILSTGAGIVEMPKITTLKDALLTPKPLPRLQLRLPNTMYHIRPSGAYEISGEATRWVAEWWSEFCALSTDATFSP